MDRDALRYALLGFFGVLAVALAAATLRSPERASSGSAGPGDPGGGGLLPPPDPPADSPGIPFLPELAMLLAAVAAVVLLWYLLAHWRDLLARWRDLLRLAALLAVGLLVWFLLFQLLSVTLSPPDLASATPGDGVLPGSGDGGDGGSAAAAPSPPPLLVVLLLAGLGVVGVVIVLSGSGRDDASSTAASGGGEGSDAAAIGRAAGRVADRLEGTTDVDNEVYRAWREMTALLDLPNPAARTPGEFAAAAVETGMDPEDVRELTRLFERVRYGGHDPSVEDERRALAVFRRIESTYTEADP